MSCHGDGGIDMRSTNLSGFENLIGLESIDMGNRCPSLYLRQQKTAEELWIFRIVFLTLQRNFKKSTE
jgi:hypothetical protein